MWAVLWCECGEFKNSEHFIFNVNARDRLSIHKHWSHILLILCGTSFDRMILFAEARFNFVWRPSPNVSSSLSLSLSLSLSFTYFQHSNLFIAQLSPRFITTKTIHGKEESLADRLNNSPLIDNNLNIKKNNLKEPTPTKKTWKTLTNPDNLKQSNQPKNENINGTETI